MKNRLPARDRRRLAAAVFAAALGNVLTGQDALRGWGNGKFATDAFAVPAADVDAYGYATAVLRTDGRIFVIGSTTLADPPPAPHGTSYTKVAIGMTPNWTSAGFALLANGSIVAWGANAASVAVPALPPNTTYTQLSSGDDHAVAQRSDGVAVAWGSNAYGQTNLPALPAGVTVLQAHAAAGVSLLLLSNGAITANGYPTSSLLTVPALPAGTTWTALWGGRYHAIARRSDGVCVGWGYNQAGQGNVPTLPPGVTYTAMGLGDSHTVALRSDGAVVAWGDNDDGQCTVPQLPAGPIAQVDAGYRWSLVRLASGAVIGWGRAGYHQPPPALAPGERWAALAEGDAILALTSAGRVLRSGLPAGEPTPPPGTSYVDVIGAESHTVVLRSDGRAIAWGYNYHGQCAIPPLPPGMSYLDGAVTFYHTLLLRSDGVLCQNGQGGTVFTWPGPGTHFVQVSASGAGIALLRSDGQVTVTGGTTTNPLLPPAPPAGVRYVEVARGGSYCAALRSDGQVATWGGSAGVPLPALPPGVVYVEVAAGTYEVLARRSDGHVVAGATVSYATLLSPPVPGPGESFVELSAGPDLGAVRVGPTSTYVTFANGCAGTRPAARLVPRDTPRLGAFQVVTLFDLPHDAAVMVFGWNRTAPIPLAAFGLPGCSQHVTADAAVLVLGQGGQARWWLGIPNDASLVGLHFHNQAVVFDAAANAAGAVVSDAAEGVIGSW